MSHKSTRISASVTPEEYEKLKALSTRARMPIGQYLVRAALDASEQVEREQAKSEPKKASGARRRPDNTLYQRDPENPHDYSWIKATATPSGVNGWIKAYFELDPFMRKEPYIMQIDKCENEIAYRKANGLPLYFTEWPAGAEPGDERITGPVYVDAHMGEPTTAEGVLDQLLNEAGDED